MTKQYRPEPMPVIPPSGVRAVGIFLLSVLLLIILFPVLLAIVPFIECVVNGKSFF